ncbi:hypothetical protein M0802_016388 [Mischocyttarus mexicanus]|nr:hypothetical protein M0802_016388 [Mischocyttarus mexicanus]
MRNLSKSIIVATIIVTEIITGCVAAWISADPDEGEENLSITLGEPMDKCDYPSGVTLKLNNYGFTYVEDYFFIGNNIINVNLENNKITEIPMNFFKSVPKMTCINIGRNNLMIPFENVIQAFVKVSLIKLNLANAWLFNATDDYTRRIFPDLDDKYTDASYIKLPFLTHLDLSRNNISALPNNLPPMFPNLTHLYLSDNNMHSVFFNRIPSTVKYVYLERNGYDFNINGLPDGALGLFFDGNTIYQNVDYKNKFENITVLSFRNCSNYNSFIPSINQTKLLDLDLSFDDIFFFEPGLLNRSPSLERLRLDNNFLDRIDFIDSLKNLTHLSLAYNNISYILPGTFKNQTNLKILNLCGNIIDIIINESFSDLEKLEKLDLSENFIISLPMSWMSNLRNLRYLDLRMNMFSSIENMNIDANSGLERLFVGKNSFIKIEIETSLKLPLLTIVYVSPLTNSYCVVP